MSRYQFQAHGVNFLLDYQDMRISLKDDMNVCYPLSWLSECSLGFLAFGYDPAIKDFFSGGPGGEFFPKGCLLYSIPALPRKQMHFYELDPENGKRKTRGAMHRAKPLAPQDKRIKSSNGNRGKKI